MKHLFAFLFLVVFGTISFLYAQEPTPSPEAAPAPAPSETPAPTPSATPEPTPAAPPSATPLPTPTPKVPVMSQDAINVIKELTKIENTPERLSGGLWLPSEYFQLVLKDNPSIPPASLEKILRGFSNYTVLGIIDAQKNPDGTKTYSSPSAVFSRTEVITASGQKLNPLDELDVDVSLARMLGVMKPKLREMAGPLGENMNFLVFPGKDAEGNRIADPLSLGKLEVVSNGHTLIWRLPLSSMVPAKICPTCHESFGATYRFCPFDGTALP